MISQAHLTAWKNRVPWPDDALVEQDLILCRALVAIFSDPLLGKELAFRGGTAIHKLFVIPPARYSEDIDLVQVNSGPIGNIIDRLRKQLDDWLGRPSYQQKRGRFALYYRFAPEGSSNATMALKVEINTREHFTIFDLQQVLFSVENPWFSGEAKITTYTLEELMGTKLRALFQRKKGRDLFDLATVLKRHPSFDINKSISVFEQYVAFIGKKISRAEFESNLEEKMQDPAFRNDIQPLISTEAMDTFDIDKAAAFIKEHFLSKLPGESWKGYSS